MSPASGESAPEPRSPDRRSPSGPPRLVTEPLVTSLLRLSRGGSSLSSAGIVLVATERLSGEARDSEKRQLVEAKYQPHGPDFADI